MKLRYIEGVGSSFLFLSSASFPTLNPKHVFKVQS